MAYIRYQNQSKSFIKYWILRNCQQLQRVRVIHFVLYNNWSSHCCFKLCNRPYQSVLETFHDLNNKMVENKFPHTQSTTQVHLCVYFLIRNAPNWHKMHRVISSQMLLISQHRYRWFTEVPARISNLQPCNLINYPISNLRHASLGLRNGWIMSSHTILGMWLSILAGIEVNPCW